MPVSLLPIAPQEGAENSSHSLRNAVIVEAVPADNCVPVRLAHRISGVFSVIGSIKDSLWNKDYRAGYYGLEGTGFAPYDFWLGIGHNCTC